MKVLLALIIAVATCGIAHAQGFSQSYAIGSTGGFSPLLPSNIAPNPATDFVNLGQSVANPGFTSMNTGFWLPLSSFASSTQLAAVNSRVNQAFDQITQGNRGIAATAAMANTWMPSAAGRTTWAINGAAFQSEVGGGISVAHRLNLSMPIAVTAAYGNGGGSAHVGRVGLMGEF
jgi:hypothetical protein